MKIILLKNVPKIGKMGDIKDVAEGYARNFLFPNRLAAPAVEGMIRKVAEEKQKIAKAKIVKDKPEVLLGKLRSTVLTFLEKADDKGNFFAGISREKVANVLAEKGINVKPKQIKLVEPIKRAGEYKISVDVAASLQTELRIITKNL